MATMPPVPVLSPRRLGLAAAGLAALLAAGCATVPDNGFVQTGQGTAATSSQDYLLQPITAKPGRNWNPTEVVSAFINATTSFANDYAAARQYLHVPAKSWDPSGFAATVIAPNPTITVVKPSVKVPPQAQQSEADSAEVQLTDQVLATVGSGGQYLPVSGQGPRTWTFQLSKEPGGWRITSGEPDPPLLYQPDFERVYLPRDLYFVAARDNTLVPSPVFVPVQATAVDVASGLVTSLQNDLPGWLDGAANTALAGTQLVGNVSMNEGTAVVNLGVTATVMHSLSLSQMLGQLVWTLASSSYGQSALVQTVVLEINGQVQESASWSGGQPQQDGQSLPSVPEPARDQPLYSLGPHGVIQQLTLSGPDTPFAVTRIPVRAGDGGTPAGPIAVSPGGQDIAWAAQSGKTLYYGQLGPKSRLTAWSPPGGGSVTTFSWDAAGVLWVVAGNDLYLIQLGHQPFAMGGMPAGHIVGFQVAPDGVRAAMIVNSSGTNELLMVAISYFGLGQTLSPASLGATLTLGTDVINPSQLAWYNSDNLIVLSGSSSGPVLQEVPVNGGSSTQILPVSGIQSISSAGPANPLVASLADGRLALANPLNTSWYIRQNAGEYPAYAG
jgi:hypothetical protein